MKQRQGTINAPDFPTGHDWLNSPRPISLAELRGKVVLLDFWTYCCINCIHIIPDLKRLEKKYPNALVIIGVHSAKFKEERDTENIRQAVLRNGIEHPVINDAGMAVWRMYMVNAWPTVALIDPEGRLVGMRSGEGVFDALDGAIAGLVQEFGQRGLIDDRPFEISPEKTPVTCGSLSFPGKVLADGGSGRIFIADTNNNRVIVASMDDGRLLHIIGGSREGFRDGAFDRAELNHPQGMTLVGDRLYIADTENHALRVADFARGELRTVVGTGRQAHPATRGGPGLVTPLNSPWDLSYAGGLVYIAMAGSHQIWRFDPLNGYVTPFAGSGREARVDGPAMEAALAQPSGLATDGRTLYIADSESSSVRSVRLGPNSNVDTAAGGDMFDFGDVDGVGMDARMQHPLGVAFYEDAVYIADTYNNKIKRLTVADTSVKTLFRGFKEPGGVSGAGGRLYIADTNNHMIKYADLTTGEVVPFFVDGLLAPEASAAPNGPPRRLCVSQQIATGAAELVLSIEMPQGYALSPEADSCIHITSGDPNVISFGGESSVSVSAASASVVIPFGAMSEGDTDLLIDLVLYYCADGENICRFNEAAYAQPVQVEGGADGHGVGVGHRVELPRG